jgi:hypothetical protein
MLVVYLAQIVHLPCVEINTVYEPIETSFHLTHVTFEFHQVCPKRFLSVLHVRRKPCTYFDEDILHYYPLAKTQQKRPSGLVVVGR